MGSDLLRGPNQPCSCWEALPDAPLCKSTELVKIHMRSGVLGNRLCIDKCLYYNGKAQFYPCITVKVQRF